MARGKLSRASVSTLAASAPPPMPSRKRAASSSTAPAPAANTTPARQSKRIKSASATPKSSGTVTVQVTPKSAIKASPKKSQYFEEKQGRGKSGRKSATQVKKEVKKEVKEESDEEDKETEETEASAGDDDDESGYEDEDASLTEPEPTEDEEAEEESEEEKPRRKGGKKGKSTVKKVAGNKKGAVKAEGGGGSGGELWREGVRSHLEPGEEVFIELPKARPAGKTPYRDETIHPNTLLFLADLKANNNRPWLKTHDADFRQAERDWKAYVEVLSERLINEVDETIPELPVKDIIFRIYRDIRFSPDPTPYKPHFSVAWSRTGRKGPYAVYYLQIGSNNTSFFGGGIWMPPADQIALLRRTIDTRADKLKSVLMQDGPRKSFLGGVPKDAKKVVKAFCASNKENALKKKPKDYDADHPEIELLKLKNFVMGRKLKDEEIAGKKGMDVVLGLMRDMLPWVTYLNSVLMPDPDADSDDDDGDDDGDDGNGDDGNGDDGNGDGGDGGEEGEEDGGEEGEEDSDPGPDPDEPEGWEPQ